jgi:hypothetical protein
MNSIEEGFDAEVELVMCVISHPAGYDLDLFGGMLLIRSTDQDTVEVEWLLPANSIRTSSETEYESFPSEQLRDAAIFFVKKRHEMKLGIDFEMIGE